MTPRDFDIEICEIAPSKLLAALSLHFTLDTVGQAFGILTIHGLAIVVSIPRRESTTGQGHRGFLERSDPTLTLPEAAARRDFTINAMTLDPLTGELLDLHGGMHDLESRRLRHTSGRFGDDPLRVLRGMQFTARLDLVAAAETVALCRTLEPAVLAPERIFAEWRKLILQGIYPSRGLRFLRNCGWVRHFPELSALIGCEQEPRWYPEGDAWDHTLHCQDAFARECNGKEREDLVVGFAVLCHDFGKPTTTGFSRDHIRTPGHEPAGEQPTRSFLRCLTDQKDLVHEVVPLVTNHLRPLDLYRTQANDSAIRCPARRVGRIDRLVRVAWADQKGRPPLSLDSFSAGDWLLARARALEVASRAPLPLVMGRHLVELGLEPGPHFGPILKACYEVQIEGVFGAVEKGVEFVKGIILAGEGDGDRADS